MYGSKSIHIVFITTRRLHVAHSRQESAIGNGTHALVFILGFELSPLIEYSKPMIALLALEQCLNIIARDIERLAIPMYRLQVLRFPNLKR